MSTHPFAGLNPRPSPWGYNWTAAEQVAPPTPQQQQAPERRPPVADQFANMPAALLSTMKREKKPFTYTPGGVNLSEVLNARLQKRMERRKRFSAEEEATPPKQVVVMPTYNTPLDMYSMANAIEALEVQAELADNNRVSSPSRSATLPRNHTFRTFEDKDLDPGRTVAQSKAFRVLQIITDTEEDEKEKSSGQHRDEMRFTGLRDSRAIPSKFFHTLQKMTGTDGQETEERRVYESEKSTAPVVSRPPPQQVDGGQQRQQQCFGTTTLKRPAAFLPIKTSPGFRPVQPPPCRLSNGALGRHATGTTDF